MIHAVLRALALLACGLALPAQAALIDNGDGTVSDTVTGLMWDKCSWGQSGTATCADTAASTHTWAAALGLAVTANNANHRGHGDWRLPSKNELESLVKMDSATSPAIDATAFPNTVSSGYLTSTSYAPDPAHAWVVVFNDGSAYANGKTSANYVRLVRGGQSFGAFDPMAVDTTPDAFNFTAQTQVALATLTTSNAITVAGINSAAAISVTGGEYRIGGGPWTSVTGTVNNGDTVTVRHTASAAHSTQTGTTLTIGGVAATFSTTTVAVVAVNGACGSVAASSFKPVGACASGTVNAAGVVKGANAWTWSCDGSGGGTSTPANACAAAFGATGTQSGGAASEVSGSTWAFAPSGTGANQSAGFIPTTGHPKSPPSAPVGYAFPHGLYDFVLNGGGAGTQAVVTLSFPSPLPAGTVWWKYGRTAANPAPHWYIFPGAVIAGNTVTLTLQDDADGDDAYATPGTIVDPGGPGAPGAGVSDIPTLSEWGRLLLAALLALSALAPLAGPKSRRW